MCFSQSYRGSQMVFQLNFMRFVHYSGYIPTRRAIGEGGYESDTRQMDDSAEDIITVQSLALLRSVHG